MLSKHWRGNTLTLLPARRKSRLVLTLAHPQREALTRLAALTPVHLIPWSDLSVFLGTLKVVTAVDLPGAAAVYVDPREGALWVVRGEKQQGHVRFYVGHLTARLVPRNKPVVWSRDGVYVT